MFHAFLVVVHCKNLRSGYAAPCIACQIIVATRIPKSGMSSKNFAIKAVMVVQRRRCDSGSSRCHNLSLVAQELMRS